MNNINITEKYTLCLLKEKKVLNDRYVTPYLIASMMVRMMIDGNLEITEKNEVTLNDKVPTVSYDKRLYEAIKDMKKDKLNLRYILSSVCQGFSAKNVKDIINLLKDSMLENKLITLETKKGLLGSKEAIKINDDKFNDTIKEIKTEFLEKENLTEDLILLASLLDATKFIKNIFNKYEKEELKNKLEEIRDTEIAKKVKVAQQVISNMYALIASSMVVATSHASHV